MDDIKKHIRSLKPRVKQIEVDLARDEASGSETYRTSAQLRIRKTQCERLRSQLNDMMMLFNQTQIEYKSRVSRRVKRHLQMTGQSVTDSQIDEMLDSKASDVFYRQLNPISVEGRVKRHLQMTGQSVTDSQIDEMLDSKASDVFYRQLNPISVEGSRMAIEDATNRHNEILQIEQSITELQEIFEDIFQLVHQQGELVNNIETHVAGAYEYTNTGNTQLKTAVKHKQSAMRKKLCVITLVIAILLILIIVAVILGVTLTGHGK
uniref:t-SNARE coiled-coil homology domain-containing protein n=1 Tax=Panagrolaimus sp. ES5 TaxID=591445 RepID=A0AC34FRP4_9BILA